MGVCGGTTTHTLRLFYVRIALHSTKQARTNALEVRAVPCAVDHGAVRQEVDRTDVVCVGGGAPVFFVGFIWSR